MIARKNRFHGYNSLRSVYKNGQTVRGSLFAVKYLKNERRTDWRLAVVVSRKVCKSAVGRNRIRRRLFEAVRAQAISEPYDIVITVFHDTLLQIPSKELTSMVKKQLRQAKMTTAKNQQ